MAAFSSSKIEVPRPTTTKRILLSIFLHLAPATAAPTAAATPPPSEGPRFVGLSCLTLGRKRERDYRVIWRLYSNNG